jgi:hypothetical protein
VAILLLESGDLMLLESGVDALLLEGDPVPPAATFLGAVVDRAMADADLIDALPGGVWNGIASDDSSVPYASVYNAASDASETNSPKFHVRRVDRVDFFAESQDELETLARLWRRAFNRDMDPLLFEYGEHISTFTGPARDLGEDPHRVGRDGRPLLHGYAEMRSITTHNAHE